MKSTHDNNPIKFKLTLKRAPAPEQIQVISLEKWRALFYRLGLVGEYPNEQIGYGNLSSRILQKTFIITGSQTGHLAHLQPHHYTKVMNCDLKRGLVEAEGLIPPSSESLTHFGIYQANSSIQSILHVHNLKLWAELERQGIDVLDESLRYGSQQMAEHLLLLLKNKTNGVMLIKNPNRGIISYGPSVEEAGRNILDVYRKLGFRQ